MWWPSQWTAIKVFFKFIYILKVQVQVSNLIFHIYIIVQYERLMGETSHKFLHLAFMHFFLNLLIVIFCPLNNIESLKYIKQPVMYNNCIRVYLYVFVIERCCKVNRNVGHIPGCQSLLHRWYWGIYLLSGYNSYIHLFMKD